MSPEFAEFHIILIDFTNYVHMKLLFWPYRFQKIQEIRIFEAPCQNLNFCKLMRDIISEFLKFWGYDIQDIHQKTAQELFNFI